MASSEPNLSDLVVPASDALTRASVKIHDPDQGYDALSDDERAALATYQAEMQGAVPAPRYRPVPLDEFVAHHVPRRRYAINGVWTERASGVVGGAPKGGKSTLVLEMAVSLATGCPFLGHFPVLIQPARVTYIQAENSTERVRRDLDEILVARGLGYMEDVCSLYPPHETIGECFQPLWAGSLEKSGWVPDLAVLSNPGLDLMQDEDRKWFAQHAAERDYIFLDPFYLLASADPNDQGRMMSLLAFLSRVRDATRCGIVLTHQLTDKHQDGSPASRMLGSTLLHGWYESALFTSRDERGYFSIVADNLREMGEERRYGLQGLGVGSWAYFPEAQAAAEEAREASYDELRTRRVGRTAAELLDRR